MSTAELEEARDSLVQTLDRYRALEHLGTNDQNYKRKEVFNPGMRSMQIETSLQLAEANRLLATSRRNPLEMQAGLRETAEDLQSVLALAKESGGRNQHLSLNKRGANSALLEAHVYTQLGKTYQSSKNWGAAERYFSLAEQIFQREKSTRDLAALKDVVDGMEMERDMVGAILSKMRKLAASGNKEETQLREVFIRFDKDGKGHLNTRDLSALATALGTFPPLDEDELEEALMQIDQSDDDEFSFEELWQWWVSDKLDEM